MATLSQNTLHFNRQRIYQLIAGYHEDDAADKWTHDPVFKEESLDQLQQANHVLLDRVHRVRQARALIFDLDSTHSDAFGNQENNAYNAHYGTVGFHPLVAFDGLTGDFLKAQLRPGNVYTSNGVVDFMRPLIEHYNETFPEASYLVRGDSGFAMPGLYDLCEEESVFYIIRLK